MPGWQTFLRTARTREPITLRVHGGRISVHELVRRLERQGFRLEAVPGLPWFLRVREQPYPLSATLEHWLGLFYIQQAVTGVAPLALGAAPGERILNLCAAPGGKAAHMADLVGRRGLVVAGDRSGKRIRALLGNLYRMGHASVIVVTADGRTFPEGALFDRVLVDVPCSAEGNLRRRGGKVPRSSPRFQHRISELQEALLRRSLALVRPGGTVLYVTCTFAPEENEEVVSRVLRDEPVTIQPIPLDLPHEPGLTSFQERSFQTELSQAWRLYPHHLDSGGLFMARLRKEKTTEDEPSQDVPTDGWSAPPPALPGSPEALAQAGTLIESGLSRLEQWTGIARESLAARRWMLRGDSIWVHGCESWPLAAWERDEAASDWSFVSAGLRAFRLGRSSTPIPTNDLFRHLGAELRDRVVTLDRERCLEMLAGGGIGCPGLRNGYVALRLEGRVLGRGRVRAGRLVSEIPRAQARLLSHTLAMTGSGALPH